jgi:hypothetical protein
VTPDNIVIELIDLLVSAVIISRPFYFGVNDDRAEAVGVDDLEGIFCKSYVSEALEGVGGLENVFVT